MTTIEEIVNLNVRSVENVQGIEYKFILEDGTVIMMNLISIRTVEEQKYECELSIVRKQLELTEMQNKKTELDLIISPIIIEDVIKEL